MARPVKRPLEQWKRKILNEAQKLFMSKGYEETSISDIMEAVGGAKGMFYRCFQSKEELMSAVGDQMFFKNNPFEAVRDRKDLNALQKVRELLMLNQADIEREKLNMQAINILEDPRILAAAIESNRRILTPLWFDLLMEGTTDGSIQTEYAKELSELLPLINFWFMPSIYPATATENQHKLQFTVEVLAKMGLPLFNDELMEKAEKQITDISSKE